MSNTVTRSEHEEAWNYLRETAEILRRLGEETDRKFAETDHASEVVELICREQQKSDEARVPLRLHLLIWNARMHTH